MAVESVIQDLDRCRQQATVTGTVEIQASFLETWIDVLYAQMNHD